MKRFILLSAAVAFGFCASAQSFSWHTVPMDGSRTGVVAASADNVDEAMGTLVSNTYKAPNGRVFKAGSATSKVASTMIAAQPSMAYVKEVIGYATKDMKRHRPESELTDFLVDRLMKVTQDSVGRKVDVGILNFGGIRTDIHQGPILLDDFLSMLPFNNYVYYVEMPGSELRRVFENFAKYGPQVFGGARIVIKDKKLVSATVGGEPLDDSRTYGLATIDFLLDGGDHLKLARNAKGLIQTRMLLRDAIIPYVRSMHDASIPLEYVTDGRVTYKK